MGRHDAERQIGPTSQEMPVLCDECISANPFSVRGDESVSRLEPLEFVLTAKLEGHDSVLVDFSQDARNSEKLVRGFRHEMPEHLVDNGAWDADGISGRQIDQASQQGLACGLGEYPEPENEFVGIKDEKQLWLPRALRAPYESARWLLAEPFPSTAMNGRYEAAEGASRLVSPAVLLLSLR